MSEAKKKMTEEEILKSIDAIIDETLRIEEQTAEEQVAKSEESKDTDKDANGGKDKIKSGSPMSVEQAEKAKAKKSEEDDDDEEDEKQEKCYKKSHLHKADKESMKEIADKEAKEEVKEHEEEMHKKKKKMKKSLEELSEVLDSEELELIKAWREESEQAEKEASTDVAKAVVQAVSAQIEDLKKAFDARLNEKDSLIKSLSDEIKKLSSQPAHSGQAVSTLETLEKGGSSETTLSKSQVLDTMLDLQKAGKGITSQHIAEFEVTKNLSNPVVRALVMEEAKKRYSN
jgi:hypothetical protein